MANKIPGMKKKKYKLGSNFPSKLTVPKNTFPIVSSVLDNVDYPVSGDPKKSMRVKIFMDDERPCPEGWLLARNPKEFFDLLEPSNGLLDRITDISFDWYMGYGWDNGDVVVTQLCQRMMDDFDYLPNLEYVSMHSSDHDKAREMRKVFEKMIRDTTLAENERGDILVYLGLPDNSF